MRDREPYDPGRAATWWIAYWADSYIRIQNMARTGYIDLIFLEEGPLRAPADVTLLTDPMDWNEDPSEGPTP